MAVLWLLHVDWLDGGYIVAPNKRSVTGMFRDETMLIFSSSFSETIFGMIIELYVSLDVEVW